MAKLTGMGPHNIFITVEDNDSSNVIMTAMMTTVAVTMLLDHGGHYDIDYDCSNNNNEDKEKGRGNCDSI